MRELEVIGQQGRREFSRLSTRAAGGPAQSNADTASVTKSDSDRRCRVSAANDGANGLGALCGSWRRHGRSRKYSDIEFMEQLAGRIEPSRSPASRNIITTKGTLFPGETDRPLPHSPRCRRRRNRRRSRRVLFHGDQEVVLDDQDARRAMIAIDTSVRWILSGISRRVGRKREAPGSQRPCVPNRHEVIPGAKRSEAAKTARALPWSVP